MLKIFSHKNIFIILMFLICLLLALYLNCSVGSPLYYKTPAGFEALIDQQFFDVDIVIANKIIGSGQFIAENNTLRFLNVIFRKHPFKESIVGWLKSKLTSGIAHDGIICNDAENRQTTCIKGNKVLQAFFSPEMLTVSLDVDPSLLASSGGATNYFFPLSPVSDTSAVIDYTLRQSFSMTSDHHWLNLGGTVSQGEQYVRLSTYNAYDKNKRRTEYYGQLADCFFHSDKQGEQLSFGLQQQWDFYNSLVGNGFFLPTEDVVAFSWGTSNKTDQVTVKSTVFPIKIFMPEVGRVEIYRDQRLIGTENLSSGLNRLNTSSWPQGVYEVSVKIFTHGELYDIQRHMVYKDSSGQSSAGFSLWGGVSSNEQRSFYGSRCHHHKSQAANQGLGGIGWRMPLSDGVSISSMLHLSEFSSSVELGTRIFCAGDTLLRANMTTTEHQSNGYNAGVTTRLSGFSLSANYDYFDPQSEKDIMRFKAKQHNLIGLLSYLSHDNACWTAGITHNKLNHRLTQTLECRRRLDVLLPAKVELQLSLQHGKHYRNLCQKDDIFASGNLAFMLKLSMLFGKSKSGCNQQVSAEYSNRNKQLLTVGGIYREEIKDSWINIYTVSARASEEHNRLWGDAWLQAPWASGSIGGSWEGSARANNWNVFTNLNGQYGIARRNNGWGAGNTTAGVLLHVPESSCRVLSAKINGVVHPLHFCETFIPLSPYQTHIIIVQANDNEAPVQLEQSIFKCSLYPGNVISFDIDAWYAIDVIGQVVDGNNQPVSHLVLKNSRGTAYTNQQGWFSMTFDSRSLTFSGTYKNQSCAMSCAMDISSQVSRGGSQAFYRLAPITCRPASE